MQVLVVTAMYPTQGKPARGTFVKEQVDSLIEAGIEVDVFAFEGKGVGNYLRAGLTLRRIVGNKKYDLIHAHYGFAGATAIIQKRCPVVITYHGTDLLGTVDSNYQYTLGGKIRTLISRTASLSAAQNIVVADLLRAKLWNKSAYTIPMGVDLSLFKTMSGYEARKQLGLPDKQFLVLFVGQPNDRIKRFDIAQEAVRLLQEDRNNVELLPIYNIAHQRVPLYMNACNVLILTSMHEASPCIVKEAMACNLPIVSVNVGDVAERIQGVEGCYLCERNPQDINAKLRQVLENGCRTNGRTKISDLSLQNIARRIITVYEQVLFTQPLNT